MLLSDLQENNSSNCTQSALPDLERKSGRAARIIFGIVKNTCLRWLRNHAKEIEPKKTQNARVNVIEMDELYSFVEGKNRIHAISLVSRDAQEIVGFDIAFDKSQERIQRLVDRSAKAHK